MPTLNRCKAYDIQRQLDAALNDDIACARADARGLRTKRVAIRADAHRSAALKLVLPSIF